MNYPLSLYGVKTMNYKDLLISQIEELIPKHRVDDKVFIEVETIQDVLKLVNWYLEDKDISLRLDWIVDGPSGHLTAVGNKGTYCIIEEVWFYVELVAITPRGLKIQKIGSGRDLEDAKKIVNGWDLMSESS